MYAAGRREVTETCSSSDIPRISTDSNKNQQCGSTPDLSPPAAVWRHRESVGRCVVGEWRGNFDLQSEKLGTVGAVWMVAGFGVDVNTFLMPKK